MVTSTLKPLTREPSADIFRVQTYCYIPCLNTLTFHNPSEPLLAQESGEDASDSRNLFGGERERGRAPPLAVLTFLPTRRLRQKLHGEQKAKGQIPLGAKRLSSTLNQNGFMIELIIISRAGHKF